jgi:hypothetical protein
MAGGLWRHAFSAGLPMFLRANPKNPIFSTFAFLAVSRGRMDIAGKPFQGVAVQRTGSLGSPVVAPPL